MGIANSLVMLESTLMSSWLFHMNVEFNSFVIV